jgi:hypothetical protein
MAAIASRKAYFNQDAIFMVGFNNTPLSGARKKPKFPLLTVAG